MPMIKVEWLNLEQQIMRVDYPQGWIWDDYHRNIDRVASIVPDAEKSIYFINVYPKGVRLPATTPSPHYRRTTRSLNIGYVVYMTEDPILKASLRMFLRSINYVEKQNYEFAHSVEESLEIVYSKIESERPARSV